MKELSLHILDILQNSTAANSSLVELIINEDTSKDIFEFQVIDNGKGMDEEFLKNVVSPFTTKRKTRKVGLGIPLLKMAAENADGGIDIKSKVGEGTTIKATFRHSHIDRQPLGNIVDTVFTVMTSYTDIDFVYTHIVNGETFTVDTRQLKEVLGDVPLNQQSVMMWLLEYLREGEENLVNHE